MQLRDNLHQDLARRRTWLYCDEHNCHVGAAGGNRVDERADLVLAYGDTDLCVRATEHIEPGACIAPCYDVLTAFVFDSPNLVFEYAFSTPEWFIGRNVYID